jgi:hypothetical protein
MDDLREGNCLSSAQSSQRLRRDRKKRGSFLGRIAAIREAFPRMLARLRLKKKSKPAVRRLGMAAERRQTPDRVDFCAHKNKGAAKAVSAHFHFGGMNGSGSGPVISKRCFIFSGFLLFFSFNSGWSTRTYLSVSQKIFCMSMACSLRRPNRVTGSYPSFSKNSSCWSTI